jgi:hypothetical protein
VLLAAARALVTAFPSVTVLVGAHRQIDRLVELHADDCATRVHAPIDLARALVACAEAATRPAGTPLVPMGAAAVHGGNALERVQRLFAPPAPMGRRRRQAIGAALIVLATTPLFVVALGMAIPALGACLPSLVR